MTTQQDQTHAPIRQALGDDWPLLGEIIRRHYDLTPHSDSRFEVEGVMEVSVSPIGRLFVSASRLFDALVPFPGRGVPVQVRNWSQADSKAMFWHRTFRYPGRKPVIFRSRMEYAGGREIVEYVKFGLGIRMQLSAEGEALRYDSRGYEWDLGLLTLPIPDWLLLGKAVIKEIPESAETFRVEFTIEHPIWGRTFGYAGKFIAQPQAVEEQARWSRPTQTAADE
jgi:hypothetical protein